MKSYEVDYMGFQPEYHTIGDILAEDKDEAEALAYQQINQLYPELQDVEILEVREV